ncbi:unnamed protein product [Phytophthora fragariaefolia]|uniref:Unnamed protein product n=1 Tax=Phytophthora fragariaefolia TaxID=1490495 RepID=A0A9W7D376_9STRA|nr:unnamed protein product [Phytophthora fragariaefolia]
MPKDRIEAAIKRGVDGKDGECCGVAGERLFSRMEMDFCYAGSNAEAVLYEASGPAGSALMVSCGEIELPSADDDKPEVDEDSLMEIAAGADDVELREGLAQVTCDPSELAAARKGFTEAGLEPAISELIYNPKEFLDLEGEQRESFDKLIDALNEDEDVNQIHHNVNE